VTEISVFPEKPRPVLRGMQDPQYADQFGLNAVEDEIIAIAGNRPETNANFLLVRGLPQRHSLRWHLCELKALLDDRFSYTRCGCRVCSRNVVLNLVKSSSARAVKRTGSLFIAAGGVSVGTRGLTAAHPEARFGSRGLNPHGTRSRIWPHVLRGGADQHG